MFDVCTNDYSAFAFPGVTADGSASWAPGGHRGLLAESSEVLEESSGVSSSAIGPLFILRVVVEDWIRRLLPFLFPARIPLKG